MEARHSSFWRPSAALTSPASSCSSLRTRPRMPGTDERTRQRLGRPGSGARALLAGQRGCSTPAVGGPTPTPMTAEDT
eukprot:2180939-Lingulodinium_polyedra.AAC.1